MNFDVLSPTFGAGLAQRLHLLQQVARRCFLSPRQLHPTFPIKPFLPKPSAHPGAIPSLFDSFLNLLPNLISILTRCATVNGKSLPMFVSTENIKDGFSSLKHGHKITRFISLIAPLSRKADSLTPLPFEQRFGCFSLSSAGGLCHLDISQQTITVFDQIGAVRRTKKKEEFNL